MDAFRNSCSLYVDLGELKSHGFGARMGGSFAMVCLYHAQDPSE